MVFIQPLNGKHYRELEPLLEKVSIMEVDPHYQIGNILLRQSNDWRLHAHEIITTSDLHSKIELKNENLKYKNTLLYRFLKIMGKSYFNENRDLMQREKNVLIEQINIISIENQNLKIFQDKPRKGDLVILKTLGLKDKIDSNKNKLILNHIKTRGLFGIDRIVIVTVVKISSLSPSTEAETSPSPSSSLSIPSKLKNSHDFYDVKSKQIRNKLIDLLDLIHGLYPHIDLHIRSSDNSDADLYYCINALKPINFIFDGSGFGKVISKLTLFLWKNESIMNENENLLTHSYHHHHQHITDYNR